MPLPFHPCMNNDAHSRVPRLHLPVAPGCNLSCRFCEREVDSHNVLNRAPGVSAGVMSPEQAFERAKGFLRQWGMSAIVGIAGPGDPLANQETLRTFRLIRNQYKDAKLCVCTNGLNLPDAVAELVELNIEFLTVTLNGLDPAVVAKIQPWIIKGGTRLTGRKGAEVLVRNQLQGIEAAVAAGLCVKINTVVVPGINDVHIAALALKAKELGARVFNPMPLIPRAGFRNLKAPSNAHMRLIHKVCQTQLPVFTMCRQCRADAEGIPGREQRSCHGI